MDTQQQPITQTNTPAWGQGDHDTLIEVRTILMGISNEVKQYNSVSTALELRIRGQEDITNRILPENIQMVADIATLKGQVSTLNNNKSELIGGWKGIVLLIGSLAGFAGLVIGVLNYAGHIK